MIDKLIFPKKSLIYVQAITSSLDDLKPLRTLDPKTTEQSDLGPLECLGNLFLMVGSRGKL